MCTCTSVQLMAVATCDSIYCHGDKLSPRIKYNCVTDRNTKQEGCGESCSSVLFHY